MSKFAGAGAGLSDCRPRHTHLVCLPMLQHQPRFFCDARGNQENYRSAKGTEDCSTKCSAKWVVLVLTTRHVPDARGFQQRLDDGNLRRVDSLKDDFQRFFILHWRVNMMIIVVPCQGGRDFGPIQFTSFSRPEESSYHPVYLENDR